MSEKHYGITLAQWREMYEGAGWRKALVETAQEIANCQHAHPMVREKALAIVGQLIARGVLNEDDWTGPVTLPEMVRNVQFSLLAGRPTMFSESKREECDERLAGVVIIGEMMLGFQPQQNQVNPFAAALMLGGKAPQGAGQEN